MAYIKVLFRLSPGKTEEKPGQIQILELCDFTSLIHAITKCLFPCSLLYDAFSATQTM